MRAATCALLLTVCALAGLAAAGGSGAASTKNLVQLTSLAQLNGLRAQGASVLASTFSGACPECSKYEYELLLLGAAYRKEESVVIAQANLTEAFELSQLLPASGDSAPTFLLLAADGDKAEAYSHSGAFKAAAARAWLNDKLSLPAKTGESNVVALDKRSFGKVATASKKHVLVEFYAPWCFHCKRLAPELEEAADAFAADDKVVIAKLDATKARELMDKYDVSGFPTLKYFGVGGSRNTAETYNGGRDAAGLVEWMNNHVPTPRELDGSVSSHAGRNSKLDRLAAQVRRAKSEEDKAAALEALKAGSKGISRAISKVYAAAAKGFASGGLSWVEDELAALDARLADMSPSKPMYTFLVKKRNVLQTFNPAPLDRRGVVALGASTFDDAVDSTAISMVEFYAPWCGHCKKLAPEYEQLAAAFADDDNVLIAKVDATAHRELGDRFGVKGYPTLKFFSAASSSDEPETYSGARTADALEKYINGRK